VRKAVLPLCILAVTVNDIYEHELKMEEINGSDWFEFMIVIVPPLLRKVEAA
jgi:hypothetical protein